MHPRIKKANDLMDGVSIPKLPEEVLELQAQLQNPNVNLVEVAQVIERNTVLAGETLTLVNSNAMRLQPKLGTIREAVYLLGTQNLYNLLICAALKNLFKEGELVRDVIDYSVDVAFCMAELSDYVEGVSRDEAYMLGLFHNSGALMLARKELQTYGSFFSNALSMPFNAFQKEKEAFGCHHGTVGLTVNQYWGLPKDMLFATLLHHEKILGDKCSDKTRTYVAMLQISNAIIADLMQSSYQAQQAKDYLQAGKAELMLDSDAIRAVRDTMMLNSF